jgi:cbb3-type cytochrome oxidase subunit 1
MKAHLRTYWWVWLILAAAVIAANEVVDRVGFDESHWPADIILAVVVVAIASYGSYAIARRRRSTA